MAVRAGNFNAGYDVERVLGTPLIGPQAGIEHIVIGDGDDIEHPLFSHVIQEFLHGCRAVTGGGMHVEIRFTQQIVNLIHVFPRLVVRAYQIYQFKETVLRMLRMFVNIVLENADSNTM